MSDSRAKDPASPDKVVLSKSNALVADWLDLLTSKGIRKQGLFIVAGERAVSETIERHPALARSLILCNDRHVPKLNVSSIEENRGHSGKHLNFGAGADSYRALVLRARDLTSKNETRFSVVAVDKAIFDELDISGTHAPLLLAHTPEISEADLTKAPVGLEILCALGDPLNVGALLRSAAAFGASKVILLKECASPFHPKAGRAASASTLITPLAKGPSIRDLASAAGPILALDMKGKSLATFAWPTNARLLIGEEGQGVPSANNFDYLAIPMAKDVESLNATVAASIALFSYSARTPS